MHAVSNLYSYECIMYIIISGGNDGVANDTQIVIDKSRLLQAIP